MTATQIRVGGVATVTGDPTGNTDGTAFDGTNAYFDYINSTQGGICGRKLVLASKRDDMLSNNRAQVQGLISERQRVRGAPGGDHPLQRRGPAGFEQDPDVRLGYQRGVGLGGQQTRVRPTCSERSVPSSTSVHRGRRPSRISSWRRSSGSSALAWSRTTSLSRRQAADVIEATFNKFSGAAKVVFKDTSVPFGGVDYSADVARMVQDKVQLVIPTLDSNGAFLLAREMKRQGLNAPMLLPNAYNQQRIAANADVANGSYVFVQFAPFETKRQARGTAALLEVDQEERRRTRPRTPSTAGSTPTCSSRVSKPRGATSRDRSWLTPSTQLKSYNANGFIPPVNWTTAHSVGNGCFAFVKVVNGKFQPVFTQPGKPFLCIPPGSTSIPANPQAVG